MLAFSACGCFLKTMLFLKKDNNYNKKFDNPYVLSSLLKVFNRYIFKF